MLLFPNSLSSLVAHDVKICTKTCIKILSCKSMNVEKLNGTHFNCYLLDHDHFGRGHFFINANDVDFYIPSVRSLVF